MYICNNKAVKPDVDFGLFGRININDYEKNIEQGYAGTTNKETITRSSGNVLVVVV